MSVDKHIIRAAMRRRRRALPAAEVAAAGVAVCRRLAGLPAYRAACSIAAYIAHENEIPIDIVLEEAARCGRTLGLPWCGAEPALARWRLGDPLVPGPGGVLQPGCAAGVRLQSPALVLVPVVAWDKAGTRLGRGGGFYDRLLARLSADVVRVALAYDFQEVTRLPQEPWDVPMHYVITERRTIRCSEAHPAMPGSLGVREGGLQLE